MMSDPSPLKTKELRELLIKNWMTHDAMWFVNCLKEFGIEITNKINQAAVRDMSAIEIKRIQKATGVERIHSFDELQRFFAITMQIVTGDFMKYRYYAPTKNALRVEWERCFAYEGMIALGMSDRYECGIMLRINTWLKTMGIQFEVEPEVTGCMMHTDGKCFRDYRFFLP